MGLFTVLKRNHFGPSICNTFLGFMRVPFSMGGSNDRKARNNFGKYDFLIFGPFRAKNVPPISRYLQQKKGLRKIQAKIWVTGTKTKIITYRDF